MINELRHAFRGLLKTPGFTAVAVITMALAIGANTAVYSLVNALLIRPLPYKAPNELVLLWEKFAGQGLTQIPVSAPEYLDYEKQTRSFTGIAAFGYVDLNLTAGEMPKRVQGAVVAPSLFPVLGVEPIGVVAALLLIVGLLACYLPARPATHPDPVEALRYE